MVAWRATLAAHGFQPVPRCVPRVPPLQGLAALLSRNSTVAAMVGREIDLQAALVANARFAAAVGSQR